MKKRNWEKWGAMTGYLAFALGIAAAAFERGSPLANAPVQEALIYFAKYRTELLIQSLLFVFSAGAYLWFFGSLRNFLIRAEDEAGRLSNVVFGAGVIFVGIQMVFQGAQVALAMGASPGLDPMLAGMIGDLTYALSVIAYVPMAILLIAVALLSIRTRVLPLWLAWFSGGVAVMNLILSFGIVANTGPLVPGAILTYVLYFLMAFWLVAITTAMVIRIRRGSD